jgi:hypothetical protein
VNANTFVEDCRREWKRLGVPEQVAEEMATELRTDLAEAAADGVAPEELLGKSAFDARGFAASWAAERGVSAKAPPKASQLRGRLAFLAVLIAAAIAIAGGVLLASASTSPRAARVALGSPFFVPPRTVAVTYVNGVVSVKGPTWGVIPYPAVSGTGSGKRTAGLILLSIGLASLILASLAAVRRSLLV